MARSSEAIASRLPEGKLPSEILNRLLRRFSSTKNLIIGPSIGVDVGITRSEGKYVVTSSDPITGASKRLGWHAVNVSANDVATSGIMPSTLCVVSLFPPGTQISSIDRVLREISSTAKKLGIAVAGGHTEITRTILKPIITVTCFGSGDRFVSAANAHQTDSILMTKTAGIEGTSILSPYTRNSLSSILSKRGLKLIDNMSVVEDSKIAFSTGKVHAMHDVTEGGVLGAVLEMSIASKVGFELQTDSIPIDRSTRAVCKKLKLDPLRLIGSGSLIIACSKKDAKDVISALRKRLILCTEIGRFVKGKKRELTDAEGRRTRFRENSVEDELWKALRKYRKLS